MPKRPKTKETQYSFLHPHAKNGWRAEQPTQPRKERKGERNSSLKAHSELGKPILIKEAPIGSRRERERERERKQKK